MLEKKGGMPRDAVARVSKAVAGAGGARLELRKGVSEFDRMKEESRSNSDTIGHLHGVGSGLSAKYKESLAELGGAIDEIKEAGAKLVEGREASQEMAGGLASEIKAYIGEVEGYLSTEEIERVRAKYIGSSGSVLGTMSRLYGELDRQVQSAQQGWMCSVARVELRARDVIGRVDDEATLEGLTSRLDGMVGAVRKKIEGLSRMEPDESGGPGGIRRILDGMSSGAECPSADLLAERMTQCLSNLVHTSSEIARSDIFGPGYEGLEREACEEIEGQSKEAARSLSAARPLQNLDLALSPHSLQQQRRSLGRSEGSLVSMGGAAGRSSRVGVNGGEWRRGCQQGS